MNCPYCDSDQTSVKDSRPGDDGRYRRYVCSACGERFSTIERPYATRARDRARRRQLQGVQTLLEEALILLKGEDNG